jgi:hypothetical protein
VDGVLGVCHTSKGSRADLSGVGSLSKFGVKAANRFNSLPRTPDCSFMLIRPIDNPNFASPSN